MRSHLTPPGHFQAMTMIASYRFWELRPLKSDVGTWQVTSRGAKRSCFRVQFLPSAILARPPAGPNVRQVTARHRFPYHFGDTPSTLRGNVGATCQRRTTTRRKARAMSTMWSSPERRGERCASCAAERVFEQPPCLDGHQPGECPEWACVECGHALFLGVPHGGGASAFRRSMAAA
jgi:hypothetical protein